MRPAFGWTHFMLSFLYAPLVQWIERLTPNELIQVRLLEGAQKCEAVFVPPTRPVRVLYSNDMDPEMKEIIEETRALAKDNHDMLRAIRRDQWLGFVGRIIVWAIVLALPLYLYQQYLQPFVEKFSAATGVTTTGPFGFPTSIEVQKLINSFKVGK